MRQIPGSPPYWQKFMYEVVAMVKQLGIPTWFLTLSFADLRWPELFQIIARNQGINMTDEQIEALSYNERCSLLNLNQVVVAKHFQYRVETFFKEVPMSNATPIGKIIHYALRIEFQMRGSPHLHALVWTADCPKLSHETIPAYTKFVDMLTFQMWILNLSSTNWLQLTRNILTLKHAENIEIYHVDLILVNSSQTEQLYHNLSQMI